MDMTVQEVITKLQTMDPTAQVMIADSIGPQECDGPYAYTITAGNADDCGDCEGRVGETVIVFSI